MDILDMHINLKLELDKTDTLDSVGFEPEELDYWLNKAIRSLTISKYKGSSSARGEAFEQNQKRIDDLRTLVTEEVITPSRGTETYDKPNSYRASLPSSTYWFRVGEEVLIAYQSSTTAAPQIGGIVDGSTYLVSGGSILVDGTTTYNDGDYFIAEADSNYSGDGSAYLCTTKRQGVTEATADTYRSLIDNPYSEHILANNKARPLRLFKNDEIELVTDGSYGIVAYYLRYIKRPQEVVYPTTSCDLPDQVHGEVVTKAADMLIENIESPRVRTHVKELMSYE